MKFKIEVREILQSIDYEGLQRGFDIDMIDKIYAR